MESVFSLDHFSAIAADLHYVLLLGQLLPEFPCTAWHISSQPAPSVPLVLSQCILLVSPASRTYFGCLRSIAKLEKSSLVISVFPEPCQVWVYSGRGSSQVRMKADKGQGQGAGQEVSPAGVGDRLDSTTKDNKR